MFEEMTYEYILERALLRVSSDVDKRQGSVIYDAIAPACAELAQMYIALENTINIAFADTAPREYLIKRGREAGIEPYAATYSVCRGIFNMEIPIGTRFNIDKINFYAEEKICDYEYRMRCETPGEEGNRHIGNLVPVNYIQGLTEARLSEVIIAGENEEDTEAFRQRYFEEVQNSAFGGNRANYKAWVKEIEGVAMAKAERGGRGGQVNVYITTPDFTPPSQELLDEIKERLDPKEQEGMGAGLAPIGHVVTVLPAGVTAIDIKTEISIKQDYDIEGIKATINEKLTAYLNKVNMDWENGNITLYSAQLLVELLDISGIENILYLTINGGGFISAPSNSLMAINKLEVV